MSIPNVEENILDPGLGIIPPSAGSTQVKLAPAQKGVVNTVYSAAGVTSARDQMGSGPMLEAVAQVLNVAGGTVLMVPTLASTYGTVTSSFALSGSGTGTVAGSKGPEQVVRVKIVVGGLPGVFTFQVAVGSGAYGAAITSGANPYSLQVPGQQFTTLVFGNFTYVANDVYTLGLDGLVTRSGSGTSTALNSSTHSPVDAYDIKVKVETAGALGTGAFRYSLDGGNVYSGAILLPSAGVYVIPNTGVVLTFAGTFTAGDVYAGTATPPSSSSTDVGNALDALAANSSAWGFFHVVGMPANVAAALTMASAISTKLTSMRAAHRFVRGMIECPTTEGDSTVSAAFASFVDERVMVCAGEEYLTSPLTVRLDKRPVAWGVAARLSAIKISTHPGKVGNEDGFGGAVKNVRSIVRNEEATPALDAARFTTMRTIQGLSGYFVTRGMMMAQAGSDFEQVMNCRVMDYACTVARAAGLQYLNRGVRVVPRGKPRAGFIDERDAQAIEKQIKSKLNAALISEGDASDVSVVVSRTDNILSTKTLNIEISIVPLAYAETIRENIGFENPALRAA